MHKYLLAFVALILVGCTPTTKIVVKEKHHIVSIPDTMLKPCIPNIPPDKVKYINGTYIEREQLLTNYTIDLLNVVSTCNKRLLGVKDLQTKQKETINKINNSGEVDHEK